jgi:hypothetical protein
MKKNLNKQLITMYEYQQRSLTFNNSFIRRHNFRASLQGAF